MKQRYSFIALGAVAGSGYALCERLGLIHVESASFVLCVCLSVIFAVIIGLMLNPVFSSVKNHALQKRGERVQAEIVEIISGIKDLRNTEAVTENSLGEEDEPCSYALRLRYYVGGREYTREFPPTLPVTSLQIMPYKIGLGNTIPVLYHPAHPSWAAIAIPYLFERTVKQQKRLVPKCLFIIACIICLYVFILKLLQ